MDLGQVLEVSGTAGAAVGGVGVLATRVYYDNMPDRIRNDKGLKFFAWEMATKGVSWLLVISGVITVVTGLDKRGNAAQLAARNKRLSLVESSVPQDFGKLSKITYHDVDHYYDQMPLTTQQDLSRVLVATYENGRIDCYYDRNSMCVAKFVVSGNVSNNIIRHNLYGRLGPAVDNEYTLVDDGVKINLFRDAVTVTPRNGETHIAHVADLESFRQELLSGGVTSARQLGFNNGKLCTTVTLPCEPLDLGMVLASS